MRDRIGIGREAIQRILQDLLQCEVPELTEFVIALRCRDHATGGGDVSLGCVAGASSLNERWTVHIRDHELTCTIAVDVIDTVTDENIALLSTRAAARLLSKGRFKFSGVNAASMATIWQLERAVTLDTGIDITTCI